MQEKCIISVSESLGFYTNREALFYRINASVQIKRPERFPTTLTCLTVIREIAILSPDPECAF